MQIPNPADVTPFPHVLELTVVINVPYTQPTVFARPITKGPAGPCLVLASAVQGPRPLVYTLSLTSLWVRLSQLRCHSPAQHLPPRHPFLLDRKPTGLPGLVGLRECTRPLFCALWP